MEQIAAQFDKSRDKLDFILARNDFIEAFADVETAISRILHSCGHSATNEPFGNRVKAFRSAEKTGLIAKANFPQRNQIADAIAAILPVRADVIHSKMRVANIDGQSIALFINAQDAHCAHPVARMMPLANLRAMTRELLDLRKRADDLRLKINPASSPQPPSPGAAGDP